MTIDTIRFDVGIEFSSILPTLIKEIYDTPFAFLRENLQNAIDATRMQAGREGIGSDDESLRIDISVEGHSVRIRDRGIGMSSDDLKYLFWTIGASGKRNEEARVAGCVGKFGIGGFANLGVCNKLIVTSQAESGTGHRTELSRSEMDRSQGLPQVAQQLSNDASPRGTLVEGILDAPADENQLRQYIQEIVRFCREPIYFNSDLISSDQPELESNIPDDIASESWSHDDIEIIGNLYQNEDQTLGATLEGMSLKGETSKLFATLRFEGNRIDIRKQGFKICSTSVGTRIGISGFIDCDLLAPTAGRDSLNADSNALVAKIVATMEREAVLKVLESSDLIDQHTRIFRYVREKRLFDRLGNVTVQSALGHSYTLDQIKIAALDGSQVFFATAGNAALTNVLQSRGHIVLNLPSDNYKARAIRQFLSPIGARDLNGQVECAEEYENLNRFEKAFLAELSETITNVYNVNEVVLTPGNLTEDIPIYVANPSSSSSTPLRVFVDVRHEDIFKLSRLGMTSLFRSMVSAFCREYLGPTLRSRSPKFFGNGAVNLDWLVRNRSETWVLLTDDITVVNRAVRRQVVTASDVRVITASDRNGAVQEVADEGNTEPKLVKIIGGGEDFGELNGYYLRIPNSASEAYGDLIIASDDHGAVWVGNKVLLVASDGISTAFQIEIKLDQLLIVPGADSLSQGAVEIDRSIQQLFEGLYFPLPRDLEGILVPVGDQKIRVEVWCDWLDFAGSRSWTAREDE